MIITIVGARPQFIKAAVVSKALAAIGIKEKLIHTGQHYDHKMSQVFWEELNIPKYDKNLEVGSGTHGKQTAAMIEKLEDYILKLEEKPKGIVLYGDTNSTLAGAIVASKLHIKIIHVESGLRSFNKLMPEEVNRILTDRISDILFCPSEKSVKQLKKEAIIENVYNVGDVMYDTLRTFAKVAKNRVQIENILPFEIQPFTLATVHRPSNTDEPNNFKNILKALGNLGMPCLLPLHPRNKKNIENIELPKNLYVIEPVSYLEMLVLLENCYKVLTDSGGLQKEAYWMRKPCVTLRKDTEWVETQHNDWNILAHNDTSKILNAFFKKIDKETWKPLYGEGNAANKIAKTLKTLLYND